MTILTTEYLVLLFPDLEKRVEDSVTGRGPQLVKRMNRQKNTKISRADTDRRTNENRAPKGAVRKNSKAVVG